MTIFCLLLAFVSVARGERTFPAYEWAFLVAGGIVFVLYLLTREPTIAAVLATIIDMLAFGPTLTRGWVQPHKDSVTSYALNSAKFVPSLLAMEAVSVATCIYPATLVVMNAAVAILLVGRRRAIARLAVGLGSGR